MAIARIALPVAADTTFDYWIPEGLVVERGALVRVRLARRSLAGVVVDVAPSTDVPRDKLQPIDELRSEIPPLPADVLELARFVATYYQEPLGLALAQMLPPLASAAPRKAPSPASEHAAEPDRDSNARAVSQNADQQRACEALRDVAGSFAPCLLQGITGSGKTEVYLSAAAERIAAHGQVLILVPEINLTPQFHERIRDALTSVGLSDLAERPARVLSGGEQQRLALARAWALKPAVLFLDEPTASLDPPSTRAVEAIVENIHRIGTTIVMTTHQLAQAKRLATDVILLAEGRVAAQTAAEMFFREPRSAYGRVLLEGERL